MAKSVKDHPKISIIIPFHWGLKKENIKRFYEDFQHFLKLDYKNYEVVLVSDKKVKLPFSSEKVKVLITGSKKPTGPAEKRDFALSKVRADIYAFIDDDSYPEDDWLKKATQVFQERKVEAVCGPGLTPPDNDFAQKVTGAILASPLGSGPYSFRFAKGAPRFVDDYPAYNLFVRKEILDKVGGWGTKFYGGEDTVLCIKLIAAGAKIYYHPEIVVYHHRRGFPLEYMKQVALVGLHRGYFAKAFPQTSFRLSYFSPAIITIILPMVVIAFLYYIGALPLLALVGLGYLVIFIEGLRRNSLKVNLILPFGVLVNHLVYGIQFIKGFLFTKKLLR